MDKYQQSAKRVVETALAEWDKLADHPEYGGSVEDILITHIADIFRGFGICFEDTK